MQNYKRPIIFLSFIVVIIGVAAGLSKDIVRSAHQSSSKIATTKTDDRAEQKNAEEKRHDSANLPGQEPAQEADAAPREPTLVPSRKAASSTDYIALYRWGKQKESRRQLNSALIDFAKSLRYNPLKSVTAATPRSDAKTLKAWAYQDQGYIFCVFGQYRDGVRSLSEAIKIRPNYPGNYLNRATAYEKLGDHDSAKADTTMAKSLSVQDIEDDCLKAPLSLQQ